MKAANQIDRYLARLIATPLLATLALSAMLLLLDKMLRLFDFVINAGGPVNVVWKMLLNLVPEYLGLGIPIGVMLGILLAFRKLALSSELDALRAIGLGYGRLLRVPYVYAVVFALLNLAIVGFLQPYATYAYQGLRFELRSGALGASLKVGEFNKLGQRMTIRVEGSADEGRRLTGVFVRADSSKNDQTVVATADTGTFLATDDPDTILLRLHRGRLVEDRPAYTVPRVLSFQQYDLPINLPAIENFRGRGNINDELTIPELVKVGHRGSTAANAPAARANFHFRIVEVAMMLVLPLLAVALAVPPKRSTSGLGIFLSVVFVVTYHKINQYAQQMASHGKFDPILALWTPFVLFTALIVWMYWTLAHKAGGQPIGALERGAAKAVKVVTRLLRVGRQQPAPVPAE